MTRQTMIAALLAGLMALAAPVGARASSLLVNGGFELYFIGWTGSFGMAEPCTSLTIGCALGTPAGETRFGLVSRSAANNTDRSVTQTVAGVGPGLYEFGVWVSLGIDVPANKGGDFSQSQVSLFAQTSSTGATAGAQPNDLTFGIASGYLGTYFHTGWFLLSGVLDLTQTESVIFNINLQQDFNTADGVNNLQLFFDNAYLHKVEVEEPVAPIPLPAAGWLLLGGLGALTALRRRRG